MTSTQVKQADTATDLVEWIDPFVAQFQMDDTLLCATAIDAATRSSRWEPAKVAGARVSPEHRASNLVSYHAMLCPVEHEPILAFAGQCLLQYLVERPAANDMPAFNTNENYAVHKYLPGEAYHAAHSDYYPEGAAARRHLSFILYLNTVEQGGETEFVQQQVKVSPVEGRAIIFPSGWTHTHKGHPTDVDRWIFQSWWSFAE